MWLAWRNDVERGASSECQVHTPDTTALRSRPKEPFRASPATHISRKEFMRAGSNKASSMDNIDRCKGRRVALFCNKAAPLPDDRSSSCV